MTASVGNIRRKVRSALGSRKTRREGCKPKKYRGGEGREAKISHRGKVNEALMKMEQELLVLNPPRPKVQPHWRYTLDRPK
ncbi:MAG: hypothetical protein Q8P12_02820 [bacterium]|nr:hypothetical protein [bacterium]